MFKFMMTDNVIDTITGLEGKITARVEYLNGTVGYLVEPQITKDNKNQKSKWIDELRLKKNE